MKLTLDQMKADSENFIDTQEDGKNPRPLPYGWIDDNKRILTLISQLEAEIERRESAEEKLKSLIREVEIGTVPVFKGSPNVDYARDHFTKYPQEIKTQTEDPYMGSDC